MTAERLRFHLRSQTVLLMGRLFVNLCRQAINHLTSPIVRCCFTCPEILSKMHKMWAKGDIHTQSCVFPYSVRLGCGQHRADSCKPPLHQESDHRGPAACARGGREPWRPQRTRASGWSGAHPGGGRWVLTRLISQSVAVSRTEL